MKNFGHLIIALCISILFTNCRSKSSESADSSDSTAQSTAETTTSKGAWEIVNVKDEFGDIIPGKSTIVADFKGKMSNSATAGADLTVRMQITADSTIAAIFYEYGRELQAQLPETVRVNTRIKLSNGEVITVEQFLFQDMMIDLEKKLLNLLLSQTSPVKVIVDLNTLRRESKNTVYNFEIDPAGLENILKSKTK